VVRITGSSEPCIAAEVDESRFKRNIVTEEMQAIIRRSSYNRTDTNANSSCFRYAKDGAIGAVRKKHNNNNLDLLSPENAIAVAKYYGIENIEKQSEDIYQDNEAEMLKYAMQEDIMVDPESAKNALDYIRMAIDKALPIVAGVNVCYDIYNKNFGEITDHFVVIIGYESEDGEITKLTAIDPGQSRGLKIVFDVDSKTGKASKEGDCLAEHTVDKPYQIDHVRVWNCLGPKSQVGVGAQMTGSPRRN
jgi:hypothetical protein